MAQNATLGDVTFTQLRALAGTIGVAHGGVNRVQLQQLLTVADARYGEDVVMVNWPAQIIRHFAEACDLRSDGTRLQSITRIWEQANPPAAAPIAPEARPLADPRAIKVEKLDALEDQTSFEKFRDDVTEHATVRGCLQIWTVLTGGNAQVIAQLQINGRQQQFLDLLKQGIKAALSADILGQLNPLIEDGTVPNTAAGVYIWIRNQLVAVENTNQTSAETELKNAKWKGSGLGLGPWVGKLKRIAAQCGLNLPVGRPRDNMIRDVILRNVDTTDPGISLIVETFRAQSVTDPGYGVNQLVERLKNAILRKGETKGEEQCRVHAAEIMTERELLVHRAETKTLLAKKDQQLSAANKQFEEKKKEHTALLASGNNGKGRGKQFYNNNRNNHSNYNQNGKAKSDKWCSDCYHRHKDNGDLARAKFVAGTHNKSECHASSGKQNDQGSKEGVRKDGDKKKGGKKGKGKGKRRT